MELKGKTPPNSSKCDLQADTDDYEEMGSNGRLVCFAKSQNQHKIFAYIKPHLIFPWGV